MENYNKDVFVPEYVGAVKSLVSDLQKDQSASKLKQLREPLLKLLVNGVPTDVIITGMVKEICSKQKNEELKRQVIYWASFYDGRASMGSKALFHLEALLARLMLIFAENKY